MADLLTRVFGNTYVTQPGTYEWSAVVWRGGQQIQADSYVWELSYDGVNYGPTGGNQSTMSLSMGGDGNIEGTLFLRVTATSGSEQRTSDRFAVSYDFRACPSCPK